MRRTAIVAALAAGTLVPCACGPQDPTTQDRQRIVSLDPPSTAVADTVVVPDRPIAGIVPRPMAVLTVDSNAFTPGGPIPVRYTADGENVSPPLTWSAGPAGTIGYALVEDVRRRAVAARRDGRSSLDALDEALPPIRAPPLCGSSASPTWAKYAPRR